MIAAVAAAFETMLFATRWLLAPLYLGLTAALCILLVKFARVAVALVLHGLDADPDDMIIQVLTLIDITLVANLVLIVMFAGYETFVSRLSVRAEEDLPRWVSSVGFSEIKLKLIASIAAISAIHLLEDFMNLQRVDSHTLTWRLALHGAFVVTGVMLAAMDRIAHAKG